MEVLSNSYSIMGNVTLFLVVTPRHDKKLAMPISGFMQNYNSRQHQQRFIEIEYICQYVYSPISLTLPVDLT